MAAKKGKGRVEKQTEWRESIKVTNLLKAAQEQIFNPDAKPWTSTQKDIFKILLDRRLPVLKQEDNTLLLDSEININLVRFGHIPSE